MANYFCDRLQDPSVWHNRIQGYQFNDKIGYDINFNKFKNHGVEIRFFDWFPEQYLTDLINFFILLAAHSLASVSSHVPIAYITTRYNTLIEHCIKQGFAYTLTVDECNVILNDLQLPLATIPMTAHTLLTAISDTLYELHHNSPTINLMSPALKRPVLVNYNLTAYTRLHCDLYAN